MVKPEITGQRDLSYNIWHRKLGNPFYMIDVDCVEWRAGRGVVALIEKALITGKFTLQQIIQYKRFEIKVITEIAAKLNVPAFMVFHTENLDQFEVYQIKNEQAHFLGTYTEKGYSDFVKAL